MINFFYIDLSKQNLDIGLLLKIFYCYLFFGVTKPEQNINKSYFICFAVYLINITVVYLSIEIDLPASILVCLSHMFYRLFSRLALPPSLSIYLVYLGHRVSDRAVVYINQKISRLIPLVCLFDQAYRLLAVTVIQLDCLSSRLIPQTILCLIDRAYRLILVNIIILSYFHIFFYLLSI